MKRIWGFFTTPQNLALLIALGGGFTFLWREVIRPLVLDPVPVAMTTTKAIASIATPAAPTATVASAGVTQNSFAKNGGPAVNINGQGTVTINNHEPGK